MIYLLKKSLIMQIRNIKFFAIFLFCFFCTSIFSQNKKLIDSLLVKIAEKQKDTTLITNYFLLAKEYQKFNAQKSIEINKKIWQLSKKTNFMKGFAHFFLIQSKNYSILEKYELSRIYAQKAATFYLKINDKAGYLNAVFNEAYSCIKMGKNDESIKIVTAGISYSKLSVYKYQIAKLNYSLGLAYYLKNNLKKSFFYLDRAISNFRELKLSDNLDILTCYNQIANMYQSTNQLDKALKYMKAAIGLIDKNDINNNAIKGLYSNLALIYIEMNDYVNALKYVKLAIIKSKYPFNKDLMAFNTNSLAIINFKQKNYDLGIKNAKKAMLFTNYEDHKAVANQTLGNCYFAKNEFNEALKHQQFVLDYIEKSEDKEADQQEYHTVYEEIAKTENALGNFKNAYQYSVLNKKVNDKILNEEKTNRINELQTKFEVSEKENALKKSITEKQKKDIEIQKQNSYITIITSILLSTVFLTFFLIRIYFINKEKSSQLSSKNLIIEKTNSKLNESKFQLEKLLTEKDVLLKEINHRVKNNLQLIISLINIQSRGSVNLSIEEFVEKSLATITSMSMVHQNLDLEENSDKVNFNEYLTNLTQSISNMFNQTDGRINVDIKCENIFFDIETAIPLGLIINELMYNAYKHAFPKNLKGLIEIKIEKSNNNFELTIKDNGVGFDENSNFGKSMGVKLVKLLSSQINGTFKKINSEKTEFLIQFSEKIYQD